MFESQLEDYGSDEQKKLKDGTITVLEFFSLFNIDFVTHNPRQSVLPGRLSSDTDVTPLDLLRSRHINRPKQAVYKADIQTLTAKVEELNVRLQDLNKPLRVVNQRLWEEMRHFSEEELQRFRAKLKERNNFFRKSSRSQSHETKEVLYSELVRVNLEEQQKLRGTISKADEMLSQLDGCISELETGRAMTEEKPAQIAELKLQKEQNSSTLKKLKTETKNLQSRIDTLHLLNEWRLRDTVDDCTTYTFLHNTLLLQLTFEKLHGNDAGSGSERKMTNVSFRFDLDGDKSQFHACLVHKLVSQHIEGQSSWVDKYPTSRHVPKLLHDVSLVVSPFRLLGEELRLLKTWGALRFDILDIGRRETE
ncbi:kinetochore scaffold 1 [Nematolebias whitei]|uniref:kinetochore scaffold 1 n=1 Tax=Nematolebias whitei TaxID=451745 RepID=UPI00189ACAB7|nr:kinetochore scaffold 1 [Nematolebias whitei]